MQLTIPEATVVATTLDNGLRVLVREDHSAPVAAVVTYVKAGYFDESDDVVGIAHVLEHMFFKGTPTRGVGEIAKQTKASGGYLNASTIYDHTRYYAVLPSAGFDAGLEIQADAYANSLIESEELRRELEVIIEEAKRKADSPSAVTVETLFELMHDRHRIRRWRIGREGGLRQLTRDALLKFYRNYYQPSNTILAIVGDVSAKEAIAKVESLYGSLRDQPCVRNPGPVEERPSGRRYRELVGDIANAHFAFGWRTEGPLHSDAPALDVAATVLGSGRASRLYRSVRNRQLATSCSAFDYAPTELGVFVVQGDGPGERTAEALAATWSEIASLGDSLSAGEVQRAQRLIEARMLRSLESMEGQANFLCDWEALGDWKLGNTVAERTLSLRENEVRDVVRRVLDPAQASLLVYRPAGAAPLAANEADAFALVTSAREIAKPVELARPPKISGVSIVRRGAATAGVDVYEGNGQLPVLVRRRPGAPLVHLGVYAIGGTCAEPGQLAGAMNVMMRSSIRGTAEHTADALAVASEMLGGSVSPATTADGIGWTISVPEHAFEPAVALLAEVVLRPVFAASEVALECAQAKAMLAQLRDDMHRQPVRLALHHAYGDHAYGRPLLGTAEGLDALTSGDVQALHREMLASAQWVLAVVGDVDSSKAAALGATAFSSMTGATPRAHLPPLWRGAGTAAVEQRDKAQSALAMLFPGPSRREPERAAARVLATIASGLGGRFFDELREKRSLAYTVAVSPSDRMLGGHFAAYIAMSPEKEGAARDGLLEEFQKLRESEVSDDELRRAKTYLLGAHAIAQQSGAHVLSEVVDAWLYGSGLEDLHRYPEELGAVSAADIQRFAMQYLQADLRAEGIVRGATSR